MKSLLLILSLTMLMACTGGDDKKNPLPPSNPSVLPLGFSATVVDSLEVQNAGLVAVNGAYVGMMNRNIMRFANGFVSFMDLDTLIGNAASATAYSSALSSSDNSFRASVVNNDIRVWDNKTGVMTTITADRDWGANFEVQSITPYQSKFVLTGIDTVTSDQFMIISDHGAFQFDGIPFGHEPYAVGATVYYGTMAGEVFSVDDDLTPVELMDNTYLKGPFIGNATTFRSVGGAAMMAFDEIYEFTVSGATLNKSVVDTMSGQTGSPVDLYGNRKLIVYRDSSSDYHLSADYENDIFTSESSIEPVLIATTATHEYYHVEIDDGSNNHNHIVRYTLTNGAVSSVEIPLAFVDFGPESQHSKLTVKADGVYGVVSNDDSVQLIKINTAFTTVTVEDVVSHPDYVYQVQMVANDIVVVLDWEMVLHAYKIENGLLIESDPDPFTVSDNSIQSIDLVTVKPNGNIVIGYEEGNDEWFYKEITVNYN